jgi:hypothetical protein
MRPNYRIELAAERALTCAKHITGTQSTEKHFKIFYFLKSTKKIKK